MRPSPPRRGDRKAPRGYTAAMRSRQTTGQHTLPSLVPVTGAVPPPGHRPPEDHLPELQQALLAWFDANARPLPWRRHYTPYEVWISEIMLQQTQMERGVSYFLRWMERFPDLPALAAASEEEVLHAWEGLGYYSRARNLLAAARLVMQEHGGVFPSDPEAIRALPGIGPYTTAAIASIAFNLPVACIDANVERVIARVFDVDSPVKSGPAAARIAELNAPESKEKPLIWCVGVDTGAYQAVQCRLRRPRTFAGAMGLSGLYDMGRFLGSAEDDLILRSSPLAALHKNGICDRNVLSKAEENSLLLCVGQGGYEGDALADTQALADTLSEVGFPCHLEVWGGDVSHDWYWWGKEFGMFAERLFG